MWTRFYLICAPCRCAGSFLCHLTSALSGAGWRLSQNQLCRQMFIIYTSTFLLVLPLVCHVLRYSPYYIRPSVLFSQEALRKENTERIHSAVSYFQMLNTTKLHGMLGKESHREKGVDVAISIITVSRNRHTVDSYEPKYLTQVVWRLLFLLHDAQAHGFHLHVHLSVCNVDFDPDSYAEAHHLVSLLPIHNRFNKISFSTLHPLEKEKQDYVYCLNKSLELNPRYVLLLEDDALPRDDFFKVLQHVIHTRIDNHFVDGVLEPNPRPGAYVKLYHPERLLGFISLEPERLPELFSFGAFLGTIITVVFLSFSSSQRKPNGLAVGRSAIGTSRSLVVWLCFFVYFLLVGLAIGRVHIVELRRFFSPHLYTEVKAPECCTPAMLFPLDGAKQVATMLDGIRCKKGMGKDIALWRWQQKQNLPAYLIQPNMVTHIGLYSALRTAILDPFVV